MKNMIKYNARLHHTKSVDDFFGDSMLQSACVRQLEIIGEAASKLSDDTKSKSIDIEWREFIGLRNILT